MYEYAKYCIQCRDDANRFTVGDLEYRYGKHNFEIRSMNERLAANA